MTQTRAARRYHIAATEPRSQAEAALVASELAAATDAAPAPPPAEVHRYAITELVTPLSLLPQPPCWGPPLPQASGLRWPLPVRDQLYTLKGAKPHRLMDLDILPDSFPRIEVRVWSRKMEGEFVKMLRNNSPDIDIPAGQLATTLETAASDARAKLLDAVVGVMDAIPKGQVAQQLSQFVFQGSWTLIKAVWEYLVYKRITVRLDVPVSIPGYETPKFIVDALSKRFDSDVTIPAPNIRWSAF